MPSDRFEFRVSYGKLLFWLLITLVPIAVVGLYSLSHSESALSRMIGTHFASIAESTAAEVSQFIHDCVVDAGVMAIEPTIAGAATAEEAIAKAEAAGQKEIAARNRELIELYRAGKACHQAPAPEKNPTDPLRN